MPKTVIRFSVLLLTGLLANLSLALGSGPLGSPALAQVPGGARVEAQTRLVCGTGTVVSAVYLPGGLLQVTCQATTTQGSATTASQLPTALGGTTLTVAPTLAVVTVLAVAAVLAGGGGTDTSTSSSSSSTGGFGRDR